MSNFFDFRQRMVRGAAAPQASGAQPAGAGAPGAPAPITVSQLTRQVESALRSALPKLLLVQGELSNVSRHRVSGHLYFTLKDPDSCVDCVMFRSEAAGLRFDPVVGMEVIAWGRIGVFVTRGKYQLYASRLEPVGQGALELAFRQLRARLEAEGLFAPQRKRPLPRYPESVALVTGRDSAACQDILKVLRRFPAVAIHLCHVAVQGEGAAQQIAAAIAAVNRNASRTGAELIILARGGGSLEDLWAFNEEIVARAVAASRLPVVTGIGHEVDTSIADLVADYHAHTPTEAAQVITAHWRAVPQTLASNALRLQRALRGQFEQASVRLSAIERHEVFRRPLRMIDQLRQLIDDQERQMMLAMSRRLRAMQRRAQDLDQRLQSRAPRQQLVRLAARVSGIEQQLVAARTNLLRLAHQRLAQRAGALRERHPRHLVRLLGERLAAAAHQLHSQIAAGLDRRSLSVLMLERQLRALGPEQVLQRGYTMTLDKRTRRLLRKAADIAAGQRLITRFADGEVESVAEDSAQPGLFE